jgi:hypothetical protein
MAVAVVAIVSVCAGGGAIRKRPVLAAGSRIHVPTNSGKVRTGRSFCARTGAATMAMTKAKIGKARLPIFLIARQRLRALDHNDPQPTLARHQP